MTVGPFYKTPLITTIFLATIHIGVAQDNNTKKYPKTSLVHSTWVQFNPFTLIEPEVPITATVLYKTSSRIAVALDAGFFIGKQNYSNNKLKAYSGIRLKPELKYYLQANRKSPHGLYVSLQGLIKRTIEKKQEWLPQLNSSGQFIFSQLANYQERKLVYGISIILGGEILLDKEQRWMLDLYGGLGFRNKQFKAINLPDGLTTNFNDDNSNRIFNLFKNGTYISIPLGLKVGYRIKK